MTDVDTAAFRSLNVPLQASVNSSLEFSPCVIETTLNLIYLLNRFLFPSTRIILEALDASHDEWSFETVDMDEAGAQSLTPILFCRPVSSGRPQSVKLVIVPIGPWEFGQRDFEELGCTGKV
jgi:hypothetical protein